MAAMRELGHRQLYAEVQDRDVLSSSQATREYLRARFRYCKSDIFSCIFLTNQHRILQPDELFQGTIDGAAVYPREEGKLQSPARLTSSSRASCASYM